MATTGSFRHLGHRRRRVRFRGMPWVAVPPLGIGAVNLANDVPGQPQAVHECIEFGIFESLFGVQIPPGAQAGLVGLAPQFLAFILGVLGSIGAIEKTILVADEETANLLAILIGLKLHLAHAR